MKKLKVNFLLIAALAIGAITMSFKMVENPSASQETQYWFEMDAAGTTPLVGPVDDIDEICPTQDVLPNCARLYNESQTTGTGSSRTVITGQIDHEQDFRTKE